MTAASKLLTVLFVALTLLIVALATGSSVEPGTRMFMAAAAAVGAAIFWMVKRPSTAPGVAMGSTLCAIIAAAIVAVVCGNESAPAGISRARDFGDMITSCAWRALLIAPCVALPLAAIYLSSNRARDVSRGTPVLLSIVVFAYTLLVAMPMIGGPVFDGPLPNKSGRMVAAEMLREIADAQERVYDSLHTYVKDIEQLGLSGPLVARRAGMGMASGTRAIERADSAGWSGRAMSSLGNWTCTQSVRRNANGGDGDVTCTRSRSWFAEHDGATLAVDVAGRSLVTGEVVSLGAWLASRSNAYARFTGDMSMYSIDTSVLQITALAPAEPNVYHGDLRAVGEGRTWIVGIFRRGRRRFVDSVEFTVEHDTAIVRAFRWREIARDYGRVLSIDTTSIERRPDHVYVLEYRIHEARSFMGPGGRYNTLRTRGLIQCEPLKVDAQRIEWAINDRVATHTWVRSNLPTRLEDPGMQKQSIAQLCAFLTPTR